MLDKPILLLAMGLALLLKSGEASDYYCDNRYEIVVSADNSVGLERICAATGKVLEFLARYDLLPKRAIRFKIVENSILSEGYEAFGHYNIHSEAINLMLYQQAISAHVNHPEMYGEPFDGVFYSGAISHAVDHAVRPEKRHRTIIKSMGDG